MFKETNDGQTQYCPMCLEWAEKYEKLKAEITHWSSLANEANERASEYGAECISLQEKYKKLETENEELKKAKEEYYLNNLSYEIKLSELTHALEEIREIASPHCSQCREIIETINEVLK